MRIVAVLLALGFGCYQVLARVWVAVLQRSSILSLGDPIVLLAIVQCIRARGFTHMPAIARKSLATYLLTILLVVVLAGPRDSGFWCGQILLALAYAAILCAAVVVGVEKISSLSIRCWVAVTAGVILLSPLLDTLLFQYVPEYAHKYGWLSLRLCLMLKHANAFSAYLIFITLLLVLGLSRRRLTRFDWLSIVLLVLMSLCTVSRDEFVVLALLFQLAYLRTSKVYLAAITLGLALVVMAGALAREFTVLPGRFPFLDFNTPSLYRAVAHEPYARAFWNASWPEKLAGLGPTEASERAFQGKSRELVERAFVPVEGSPTDVEAAMRAHFRPHNLWLDVLCNGGLIWLSGWLVLILTPLAGSTSGWTRRRRQVAFFLTLLTMSSLSRDLDRLRWFLPEIALCHAAWHEGGRPDDEGDGELREACVREKKEA